MARGLVANQRPAVTGRVRSIRTLSAKYYMEGTAKWLATGFEPQGRVTARRSIRLPSAKTASEMLLAAYQVANLGERVRTPSDAPKKYSAPEMLPGCMPDFHSGRTGSSPVRRST